MAADPISCTGVFKPAVDIGMIDPTAASADAIEGTPSLSTAPELNNATKIKNEVQDRNRR
ncbi:hypothetical protein Skr01_75950 [Sphaerisporangium krabiense]|nr:hypothetical protein Skr01_75950 [Sphaerisporangium krabiense]